MRSPLSECIERFGAAPREFGLLDRLTYLRVPKPLWLHLDRADELTTLFHSMRTLFANGTVVWGHIIQANVLMFKPGHENCPGEVVYSLDDGSSIDPGYLQQVAHELFSLKGTQPADPNLLPIANYLTDELIRVYGLGVPGSVSPLNRCQISTTFFVRKHLPNRRLCSPLLPIIVNPTHPYVAMPLPERFWPQDLKEWWSS